MGARALGARALGARALGARALGAGRKGVGCTGTGRTGAGQAGEQARITGGAGARHNAQGRVRRYDTTVWGCDTAGGLGHDTTPVRASARLYTPGHAGWAVCAHYALDQFLTQYYL